jgi:glucosylceramidase
VRISSGMPSGLPNVAFRTPAGRKVLIVLNDSGSSQSFNISFKGKTVAVTLDKNAVATYIW